MRVIHTGQALVDVVLDVADLPQRGQNVMAGSAMEYAGGAVNVLIAAARAGAETVHAGAIGTGPRGDLIRAALAADGVAVAAPAIPDADTGICVVLVEPSAERTFVTTLGAERRLSVAGLDAARPAAGDLVCLTGYTLVMPATADPLLAWLPTLAEDVDVVLDPGAAFAGLPADLRDRTLAATTVWTSNAEEAAAFLAAVGHQRPPHDPDANDPTEMADLARAVAEVLPELVVIVRDGPIGCALVVPGAELLVLPGYPQRPVDTNGAGDTHTGVLVAQRSRGVAWAEACRQANAAAAIKVTRHGPATAPTAAEVASFRAAWVEAPPR